MKILKVFLFLFVLFLPSYVFSQTVKIGVLALQGVEDAQQKWQGHIAYLNRTVSSKKFELVPLTFNDIPAIVSNHQVDYVIVNPAIYVQLAKLYQVKRLLTIQRPVANQKLSLFGSVLITHTRHRNKALVEFKKEHLGAVHKTSLGGWLIGLYKLNQHGLEVDDFASISFLGTHNEVVEQVVAEKIDLGVVRTGVIEEYLEKDPKLLEKILGLS